jgi:glycosyltransferase involved in cell wall biosynthesis
VRQVHVVVPDGIDDPGRPSGGNTYDRAICDGLAAMGWGVRVHAVAGSWPLADETSRADLDAVVGQIPDGAVVLIDGLVASTAEDVLVPQASRLRLVALVHMALGHSMADDGVRAREAAVLSAATAVVTTSAWSRETLIGLYALAADRVHVAEPGVERAGVAPGTSTAGALLCVAAVIPGKGHDVLVDALAALSDLAWRCTCVGRLDRDPDFAEDVRRRAQEHGVGDRVSLVGPWSGADLDRAYAAADLLVLASHGETYGMVVTEALARGLPVVATAVGGVPEALGTGAAGTPPGILVPPGDPAALSAALRVWLGNAEVRERLRRAARERRATLPGWTSTTSVIASVLAGVPA